MGKVNYPPKKIYTPSKWNTPNYDHIILWMLNNNEICKWADFCREPVEIPPGTLSRHLETLKRNGYVEKFTRGQYRITSEGKKEFRELSTFEKKAHKLNYPPTLILKSGRNYSHWILWMVYNNDYCKRSEFLEDPLGINQSSLSKNLSLLVEKGFIIREESKYVITGVGKSEYSRMLQEYDLDRQTILEEEGKRIEEITNKTVQIFEKFKIKDKNVQFRFLTSILTLEYEKVKPVLKEEEIFHKILLFLSINHPDQYPQSISSQDFSDIYKIKKTTLDYYIDEISGGKIYPIRFFRLEQQSGKKYYFKSNGSLEKMLRVITENTIIKVTYLNRLFAKTTQNTSTIDMASVINDITDMSCDFLVSKGLEESLREFLPEYIKYLAYKIEAKRELKEIHDKLEGIIWQNISDVFQPEIYENLENEYEKQVSKIDKKIKLKPGNLNLYYLKFRIFIYFNQYQEALKLLDNLLKPFPESEKDIKLLTASVHRRMQNIEAGLSIINNLTEKFPKDNEIMCYKAYWMQYLDEKEESIKIIDNLVTIEPENGMYQDTYGEILMYFEDYEEAAKRFLKTIVMGGDEWYIPQTYIKLGICYKTLEKYDLAIKNLKQGKNLTVKSKFDTETKQKWLAITDLILAEIEQLGTYT